MKKFAFLGAVSAIALMCTPVLADPPRGGGGPDIEVEDVQVPVVTGDGSGAIASDIDVDDSLNGNKVNSFNGNSDNSDNSDNSTNTKTYSKVETKTKTTNVTKTKTTNVAVVKDNTLLSNNTTNSNNTLTDSSTNVNVQFDDVMANVNATSANVGGVAAQAISSESAGFPQLSGGRDGRGGRGDDCCSSVVTSASTGNIGGVTIQSTHGITAANLNTGVASQANNISLNAQISNP